MDGLPFDGLTVVVTGDVAGFTRESANDAVVALGGTPVGSVSGRTGLIVVGDGAGVSKMGKARQHNTLVIDADTFADLAAGRWDGEPVGEPCRDFEARLDPDPEPAGPYVPFADRHRVGFAALYPDSVPEYRLWCSCGETWLGSSVNERTPCPKDPYA